jgi:hypothetical protein
VAPFSDEYRDFRYLSWQLAGLLERQSYSIQSLEGKKKLKNEMEYVELLRLKINENPSLNNYPRANKKKLEKVNGNFRIGKILRFPPDLIFP